jgi:hypothetical protein
MIENIVKTTIFFKNIDVIPIIILVNIYKIDIIKIKNIIFIILFIFNNIFKFNYNII